MSKWQIEALTGEITCPRSPRQSVEEMEIGGTVFVSPNVKSSFLLLSVHSVFMNIAIYFIYRLGRPLNKRESHLSCRDVGRRYGGGHQGGSGRKWSCWEVQYDSAILQGDFYKRLQENHWCRFPGKTNPVCIEQMSCYPFLPFLLFLCSVEI